MWETSGMCGRFFKSAIPTYVDVYIDFFRFFLHVSWTTILVGELQCLDL
jgi:hypothetical protein